MSETPTTEGVVVTPLEHFLARAREASAEVTPFPEDPALAVSFAKISNGYAEFIDAARADGGQGYEAARRALVHLANLLPPTEDNSFENIVHALRFREG